MSVKLCFLVLASLGLLQVPINGAPQTASNESLSKFSAHLQKLANGLSQKLEALSTQIDNEMEKSDAQLTSSITRLEESWAKTVNRKAAEHEGCSNQTNRLFELSTSIISATTQCASKYRQKLEDIQSSSRFYSKSLQHSVNKLVGISVNCVEVNGQVPLCSVLAEPLSLLANLLPEAGETVGKGAAQAEAYGAQILSCWKQSSAKASPLAQEIIRDIAQCAKAPS